MDLAEQLERAIPGGPPLPPPEQRATAGQRALRRRRAAATVAAAGAVAAVVVPFAVAVGGTASRGHDPAPPVSQPSPPSSVEPGRTVDRDPARAYPWAVGEVAAATPFDGLLVRPGAQVLSREDDLYPGKDTESVALRLRFRGLEHWAVLEWDAGGATDQTGGPGDPFHRDYADFVAEATNDGGMTSGPPPSAQQPDEEWPEPVDVPGLRWTGDRIAVDAPGRIVEQRSEVVLPENFAAPGEQTGAALVELGEQRALVLYRAGEGGPGQLIAVSSAGHGESFDALLVWARERYRSRAGLL